MLTRVTKKKLQESKKRVFSINNTLESRLNYSTRDNYVASLVNDMSDTVNESVVFFKCSDRNIKGREKKKAN